MEPKDILRRHHVFLKDHLDVTGVLDRLFQEGVFTDSEVEECRAGDVKSKQCNILLDTLRRKHDHGYRTFCAILDDIQPNIKKLLDEDGGAGTALYVNKNKIERKYKALIDRRDARIAQLEKELEERSSDITHMCAEHKKELDASTSRMKLSTDVAMKEKEQTIAYLQQRIHRAESGKLKAEKALEKSVALKEELQSRIQLLEEEFADCKEKYAAITQSTIPERCANAEDHADPTEWKIDTCTMCRQHCEENQVMYRLPCIHLMCQTCLEHLNESHGICSECSVAFARTDIKLDTSRRNKARWEDRETRRTCTHNDCHYEKEAVCYCPRCEDYLCAECNNNHGQIRNFAGHTTYSLEEIQTIPYQHFMKKQMCHHHEGHDLVLYDHDCKIALCLVCIQDDHQNHSTVHLEKVYEQEMKALEVLLRDLEMRSEEIKRNVMDMEDYGLALDKTEASLFNQISVTRERMSQLLLQRDKQVQGEVIQSLEAPRMALKENLARLLKTFSSVKTAIRFGKQILQYCSKSEFLELKPILHDKSMIDLNIDLPSADRRGGEVRLLFHGQNNLERMIQSFFSLYCPMIMGAEPHLDATPTVEDYLRRINFLAERVEESERAITCQTKLLSKMDKDSRHVMRQLDQKTKELQSTEKELDLKDTKLKNLPYLEQRCGDLQDKLKKEKSQHEEKMTSLNKSIDLFRKRCEQLEQALEQTVVCVGSHRNGVDNFLIVCPRLKMCIQRVNTRWCSVENGELSNMPSDSLQEESGQLRFRKFWGTSCSQPLHPAPCQVHHEPTYWEVEADIAGIDDESLKSQNQEPILETGVVEETVLDTRTFMSAGELSWCVVLCLCSKHECICKQIWQHGQHIKCVTISKAETVMRFGVVLDAVRSKLTFLDILKNDILRVFDLEHTSPLWLTFGVSTKIPFSVKVKLISGTDLEMNARKKGLILKAVSL